MPEANLPSITHALIITQIVIDRGELRHFYFCYHLHAVLFYNNMSSFKSLVKKSYYKVAHLYPLMYTLK